MPRGWFSRSAAAAAEQTAEDVGDDVAAGRRLLLRRLLGRRGRPRRRPEHVLEQVVERPRAAGLPGERIRQVPDAQAAYELLGGLLRRGDIVLFKSSRDSGLRWLGDRIAGDCGDEGRQEIS